MCKRYLLGFLLFFTTSAEGLVCLKDYGTTLTLTTLYGTMDITEPVLIDLIRSWPFQRLKKIHQYGVMRYAVACMPYTRYDHSLGVFFLTYLYGATIEEQIAALMHDVSHTVFSHVGDIFFAHHYTSSMSNESYQDTIEAWYLQQTGIIDILKGYGYAEACTMQAKRSQRCYEQSLPDLCADRIEYNLTGAYVDNMLTADEIRDIRMHLHFDGYHWFFDAQKYAFLFGCISLVLCESRWGSPWSAFINRAAADALHRACEIQLLSVNDIHFSEDDSVWERLCSSHDPLIKAKIAAITSSLPSMKRDLAHQAGMFLCGRFTGTDPLVDTQGILERLTHIDPTYKDIFKQTQARVTVGVYDASSLSIDSSR